MEKIKKFILIALYISSSIYGSEIDIIEVSQDHLNDLINSFEKQMEQEFDLHRGGGGMNFIKDKVEGINLSFNVYRRATIEEGRLLHVLLMKRLLQTINSNETVKPGLIEYPFTYRNISLTINFNGPFRGYCDGSVTYMFNISDSARVLENRNHLFYHSADPITGHLIDLMQEPYEEAIRLAQAFPVPNPKFHETTEQEYLIDQAFDIYTNDLKKQYGLCCSSIGGKLTNGIEEIGAKFTVFHPANIEEARELELITIEKLLTAINNNEKLRPYLFEYPFTANRLKIRIEFKKKDYFSYRDGSLESVSMEGNEISYSRWNPVPKGTRWENRSIPTAEQRIFAKETYQEALNILQNSSAKGKPDSKNGNKHLSNASFG